VTIGKSIEDNSFVSIGNSERKSGVYILGKPRMGKSSLIVNMLLQDIENGCGVFFLDPHGDAIEDLINRLHSNVILLDPEYQDHSFGINLLECANINSMAERNTKFTKAKGVKTLAAVNSAKYPLCVH
jgi:DNA helicase HerA-like ATPase